MLLADPRSSRQSTGKGEESHAEGFMLTRPHPMPWKRRYAASPAAVSVTTSPLHSSQSPPPCRRKSSQKGPLRANHCINALRLSLLRP